MKLYEDIKKCEDGVDEKLKTKCKCGKNISINVGDSIQDGAYLWYISYHCEYCGETVEMDGHGIFDIPYNVKQEILDRNGEWCIIARGFNAKIRFLLKNIIYDEYNIKNIHKENVVYVGTQNQVKWVKYKLIEKGIDEREIEIKLLTLRC